MVSSFRRLRGFAASVLCSSISDLLLPLASDVSTTASSPECTKTGSSGRFIEPTIVLRVADERVSWEDFDKKFGVLL